MKISLFKQVCRTSDDIALVEIIQHIAIAINPSTMIESMLPTEFFEQQSSMR